jgi:hypothetical protein
MPFALDLAKGKKFERLLVEFLKDCGFNPKLNEVESEYSHYDVTIDNPKLSFEMKADLFYSLSKNIAIEYHNSKLDKPSGIIASKADWWVHGIYHTGKPTLYFAKRLELIQFMRDNPPHKHIIGGGDKNSNMYIYKEKDILGKILVNLNVLEATKLFKGE